jgi:KDO2-lipid IV(A) lauroyltransferase
LFLKAFSFLVNLFPEDFALWLGRQLGKVWYCLDFEHRKVAIQNLRTAFGQEKSASEIRYIARRTFQNLGMMAIEFFRIPRMDMETFKRRVRVEGLKEALPLLEKKKGALLLIGHFGNWEMMGLMSKVIGNPIVVIAKPMKKNQWVDQFIA